MSGKPFLWAFRTRTPSTTMGCLHGMVAGFSGGVKRRWTDVGNHLFSVRCSHQGNRRAAVKQCDGSLAVHAPGVPCRRPQSESPSLPSARRGCWLSGRRRRNATRGHPLRQYGGSARSAAKRTRPTLPPRGVVPVSHPTRSAPGQSQTLGTGCLVLSSG